MSTKTKNVFVIAIILIFFSVGICSFLLYEIKKQGLLLEEQVAILNENNNKEAAFLNIKRAVQETEAERQEIAGKFFATENHTITFLNEIDKLALAGGFSIETKSLDEVFNSEKKLEFVKVSFAYSGLKEKVLDFTELMENIPYYSYVESLSFKKISDNNWEGKITILISVQ